MKEPRPWDECQDKAMILLLSGGFTIMQVAKFANRTYSDVKERAKYYGVSVVSVTIASKLNREVDMYYNNPKKKAKPKDPDRERRKAHTERLIQINRQWLEDKKRKKD